ncbi:LysR family transcriptional regulator [Cupriavidus basilensis OR16]|uniref:LysR family transcriptional regulator n=1 Tax=Cupriavidus basilensis OR16 TaxID=1127483 RepID=H1SDB9_9BURK|nr:LysR family transcriptional regulator [Cupriavidus basilensis OR16]
MLDWESLRHFLAVARTGTLSGAARDLQVDHATVSRRLAALEAGLQALLVERLPRSCRLTPLGVSVFEQAKTMEAAAFAIERQTRASHEPVSGKVSLSAPPVLTTHLLAGRLADFRAAYPGIQLSVSAQARAVSLTHCLRCAVRRHAAAALAAGTGGSTARGLRTQRYQQPSRRCPCRGGRGRPALFPGGCRCRPGTAGTRGRCILTRHLAGGAQGLAALGPCARGDGFSGRGSGRARRIWGRFGIGSYALKRLLRAEKGHPLNSGRRPPARTRCHVPKCMAQILSVGGACCHAMQGTPSEGGSCAEGDHRYFLH